MGLSVFPAAVSSSKTAYRITLTSGTSWTVPTGVTYVNVTLQGGGGSGVANLSGAGQSQGQPGQMINSTLATTPGASITYAIGAGGSAGSGGATTFTGATTANGGLAGGNIGTAGTTAAGFSNGGGSSVSGNGAGGVGGAGKIDIEYWV